MLKPNLSCGKTVEPFHLSPEATLFLSFVLTTQYWSMLTLQDCRFFNMTLGVLECHQLGAVPSEVLAIHVSGYALDKSGNHGGGLLGSE